MNLDRNLLFSWIEEDNVQKAYFRIRPLLTAEGDVRAEAEQLWPSEGCLRIVPDRNELHSFKGRMRALGNYCMVDLRGLPADAGKIRTNKNFRPEKGEPNQFILYSDTVKSLPEHSFYHIVEGTAEGFAAACEAAITPLFYIREGDTLYGPVRRETPEKPEPAKEAAGTLFEVACPDDVTRMILCMDDAPALPQPVETPAPATAEAPAAEPAAEAVTESAPEVGEAAPAKAAEPEKAPEAPVAEASEPSHEAAPEEVPAETPLSAPAKPQADKAEEKAPEKTEDTPLPIAERLEILDSSKGHDETLQALDKPVSRDANLLRRQESRLPKPQPAPKSGSLSGTHLMPTPLRTSTPQPKNKVQELATGHFIGYYEPPAGNLPNHATLRDVPNPVESACQALRQAWHATDSHPQLLDCILSLDGFRAKLEDRLCKGSNTTLLQKVLRDHLQDLEAERLHALCELDRARRNTDAYRDEITAAMKKRLTREHGQLQQDRDSAQALVNELKAQIDGLTAQRDALDAKVRELQQDMLPAEIARLVTDAQMLSPALGTPLRLSPVTGTKTSAEDMIARLMAVCAASGVAVTRNHAVALLALLAIMPRFGVVCPTMAPLATLSANIAGAFGWSSGFAHQTSSEQRPLVSARPVDGTPVVLMTSLQQYATVQGVNKVILSRNVPGMVRNAAFDSDPWPVLVLPALPYVDELGMATDEEPVSAASLAELLEGDGVDVQSLRVAMEPVLRAAVPMSGSARKNMFRFIDVCARYMEGGIAAAADWAILLWVIPGVDRGGKHCAAVRAALDEYPLSQAALS